MDAAEEITSNEASNANNNGNPDVDVEALAVKFNGFDFLNAAGKLHNHYHHGEPVSYPTEVERRLKALKKLQVDMFNTECKFFEELHDLETKYSAIHAKHCNKRSEIVLGKYEPTEEECDFTIPGLEDDKKEESEDKKNADSGEPVSGVPRFWLTIFRNVEQFADTIHEHDIPILEHLEDVRMELTKEPMGFKIFFHFSPNEFFTNSVLTKTYEMRVQVDPKDPLSFEGTEIYKSTGCKINWKEGKDVTIREIKKKQKHKSTGAIRMTTKMVSNPSFFEFFNPPTQIEEDDDSVDPDLQDKITLDFELGSFLKERIIPRAVLYFTGEALESDDEEEEEFTGDEDSDGDEESGSERLVMENSATDNEEGDEK